MRNESEPRFDIDLAYGQQGELQVKTYLEWIAGGNGRVEVKRKDYLDVEFYVEMACDKGRTGTYQPSGLNVTTAECWAFVIADTGITLMLPTELLRQALGHRTVRAKACLVGNCPTRGFLINLGAILDVARANAEDHK